MTPDDLTRTLRAVRAHLRISRTVEMAVRWTLYASLLACVCLAASKFLPIAPQLAAALALIPLGAAAAAAARRIPLHDCAVLLDGAFRLDERVSTAAEVTGDSPMARAVREDARRALEAVDARGVGRVRWPRETRLLLVAAGLLAALALAPSPRGSLPAISAGLEAEAREQGGRLKEAAADPRLSAYAKELARILELLESKDPARLREAVGALGTLEDEIGRDLAGQKLPPEMQQALNDLADRAAAAGIGIGRALAAMGIDAGRTDLAQVGKRLERAAKAAGAGSSDRPEAFNVRAMASAAPVPPGSREAVERALDRHAWASKYDETVKRYYEENP